jgi:hypothetical protein
MRPRLRRPTRQLAAAATLATALAGGALATAEDGLHPAAPSTDRVAVAAISPDAPALIAAFRRAQTADDRLPGNPHASLVAAGEAQPGEQPGMARRLAFADGRTLPVWPKAYGLCYGADGGGGCFDTSLLRARGLAVATSFSSDTAVVRVYAIARDGIESATFVLGDGREVEVPVRGNGFIADVPDPKALRWRNVDGSLELHSTFVPSSPG